MFIRIKTNVNPELVRRLREVQDTVIKDNYYTKNWVVPVFHAHVCLTVFELVDMRLEPFLIEEFQRSLSRKKSELLGLDRRIQFRGSDCFNNGFDDTILCTKPVGGMDFLKLAHNVLQQTIDDNSNILKRSHGYTSYNPHLTLFRSRGPNCDYVNWPEIAAKFSDITFGYHLATSIELCKIPTGMVETNVLSQFDLFAVHPYP